MHYSDHAIDLLSCIEVLKGATSGKNVSYYTQTFEFDKYEAVSSLGFIFKSFIQYARNLCA